MVTGNRLGMKTPVADRCVFFPAGRTHRESRHGCLAPIIRQITDNGKARSTMRTVDKRILQTMRLHLPVT